MALGADASRQLTAKNIESADIKFPENFSSSEISHFLNGLILGNYKFEKKCEKVKESSIEEQEGEKDSKLFKPLKEVNIRNEKMKLEDSEIQFKITCAQQALKARNWANERADIATPAFFISESQRIADKYNLDSYILQGKELLDHRMNLLYAVGKGSVNPPALVNLVYKGNPTSEEFHSLIGKGITFDCGGLNIKPTGYMETMYMDKAGSCAVLAAFEGAVKMKMPV